MVSATTPGQRLPFAAGLRPANVGSELPIWICVVKTGAIEHFQESHHIIGFVSRDLQRQPNQVGVPSRDLITWRRKHRDRSE